MQRLHVVSGAVNTFYKPHLLFQARSQKQRMMQPHEVRKRRQARCRDGEHDWNWDKLSEHYWTLESAIVYNNPNEHKRIKICSELICTHMWLHIGSCTSCSSGLQACRVGKWMEDLFRCYHDLQSPLPVQLLPVPGEMTPIKTKQQSKPEALFNLLDKHMQRLDYTEALHTNPLPQPEEPVTPQKGLVFLPQK